MGWNVSRNSLLVEILQIGARPWDYPVDTTAPESVICAHQQYLGSRSAQSFDKV